MLPERGKPVRLPQVASALTGVVPMLLLAFGSGSVNLHGALNQSVDMSVSGRPRLGFARGVPEVRRPVEAATFAVSMRQNTAPDTAAGDLVERSLRPRPAADAAAAMKTANQKNHADGLAAYDRALLFLDQEAFADASREFRNAEKKDDENIEFIMASAYGYLKVHNAADALKRYEKHYKKDPRNLRALVGMAAAFEDQQNYREAVRTWQRYTKASLPDIDVPAGQARLRAAQALFVKWYEIAENPAGGADNLLTPQQELELGLGVAREFSAGGVPTVADATVVDYIGQLCQTLVTSAKRFPTNYQVLVLDTADVNAFTVPGFIFVNRGLLASVETEAELAGVLAHEIAHSVAHHFGKKQTKAYQDDQQLAKMKASNSKLAQFFAKMLEAGNPAGQLSFSRDAEYQADRLAVHICYDAGIDPLGFATFFQKLEAMDPSTHKSWDLMRRTHPFSIDRLRATQEYAALLPEKPAKRTSTAAFTRMQARLAELPQPQDATGQLRSAGEAPQPPREAPRSGSQTQQATRTFTMDAAPFAGEIPGDWAGRQTESDTIIFEGPQGTESYEVSVELGLERKRSGTSIDMAAAMVTEVLEGKLDSRVEPVQKNTASDGTPVRVLKATYAVRTNDGRQVPITHLTVILDYPGYYVLLSYFTPTPIFEKYSEAFTLIMQRLRYTGR